MRDLQGLLARIFDVAMIFIGAAVASQIRFNYVLEHRFYVAFVAFAAAFSLALFPASASTRRARPLEARARGAGVARVAHRAGLRACASCSRCTGSTTCRDSGSPTGPRCRAAC